MVKMKTIVLPFFLSEVYLAFHRIVTGTKLLGVKITKGRDLTKRQKIMKKSSIRVCG